MDVIGHDDVASNHPMMSLVPGGDEEAMHIFASENWFSILCADSEENNV
jgi:hypothetical protein